MKAKITTLKYKVKNAECIENCPYEETFRDRRPNHPKFSITRIGSVRCDDCRYQIGKSDFVVRCSHPPKTLIDEGLFKI
jgi:hypothetical protein